MRNKGFTLIELLAVIVILAIIALIATPIVLGIIDDSKENSNRISAEYMIDAAEKAYSMAYTKKMGAIPTLEEIAAEFDMSGAEWVGNTISTTNDEVVCSATVTGTSLIIDCPDYKLKSSTMEIVATPSES